MHEHKNDASFSKRPPEPIQDSANDESIQPVKRSKKTTYFFKPVNRLTKSTTTAPPTTKEIITPIDPNTFNSVITPVHEIHSPRRPSNENKRTNFVVPEQSSDDSFDGIRWKESPKNRKLLQIETAPSSPLRKVNKIHPTPISILKHVNDEVVNEQANNVLSKYGGCDLRNMSTQIPTIQKAHSDLSPSENKTQNCPSLSIKRSKSIPPKTTSVNGTLRNWINKFEHTPQSIPDSNNELSSNQVTQTSIIQPSSDPFSDDDNELVDALHKATQIVPSSPIQLHQVHGLEQVGDLSFTGSSDSEDPFSDDDSELIAVINHTQKPDSASSISSTQSRFAKSFQEGMKNFEQLQIDKASYERKDDSNARLVYDRSQLRRYMISKVTEQGYGPSKLRQLILEVVDGDENITRFIVRGEYCELEFQPKDIIHIVITNNEKPNLIDDGCNLLIWNPDVLLSVTTISQQIICPRKSVIQGRYKFPGELSVAIIVGELTHRIFQQCVIAETWTSSYMEGLLKEFIDEYLLAIFSIGPEVEKIKLEVCKHLPYLESWFKKYYKKPLSKDSYIDNGGKNERIMFSVEEALDIEENIWSPMFGIKGKVDITVTANLLNKSTKGKFLMPLEIKTGREHITHHAQASLYSLLFKDRYDMEINAFLLVYTKEQLTKKGDISKNDLRSLVNLRNRISQYFKDNVAKLPDMLRGATCDRCEMQEPCMVLNHLVENGTKELSGIAEDRYLEITNGILENEKYRSFFRYWDELIASEENIMSKTGKHLWTMTSAEREQTGNCLGNMVVVNAKDSGLNDVFEYTFARAKNCDESLNLVSAQMIPSDRIIISDEDGHFAIASGTVKTITKEHIVITTRRRIITSDYKLKHFNEVDNQVFQSVLRQPSQSIVGSEKLFRLDRDEMFYGMGLARFNILNLFLPLGDVKTRRLVVDLDKPTYSPSSWSVPQKKYFNMDQIQAFQKVFTTNDYSLILGMPGTGKTTVLAELIRVLVGYGKSILLASYTNSAVDNILIKLIDSGIGIVRIGHKSRVHKKLHKFIPNLEQPITSYEQYLETYASPPVVATTCLGINDLAFNIRNRFDYCIIDEASQVSLPINIGPLRFSDKFILVGDHYQLPPLVQHPDPRIRQGLSVSLFKLLAETYPESVCELTYQYRMCEDIMQLSNVLVYNNRLKCGSELVAKQVLNIPAPGKCQPLSRDQKEWMSDILDPQNRVLFLDHDNITSSREITVGETVQNPVEAKLIYQIAKILTNCGVTEDQIGVMSFYRAQLKLLKRMFGSCSEIEILTADQYQGRDKDCIIISLVRSNEENRAGDLIKEWRRLNVAITRAKSKLIILGSRSTLSTAGETTKTFIDFLENRGWYYVLPENADKVYDIPLNSANSSPRKKKMGSNTQLSASLLKKNPILNNILQDMTG